MKKPREERESEEIKCRRKRKVKTCYACCRFQECFNNVMPDWSHYACIKLGNEIIASMGEGYCKAWESGKRGELLSYTNNLRSTFPSIITANTTDGYALEESLRIRCERTFGDFETIYKKRLEKYQKLIDKETEKLRATKDLKQRAKIRNVIDKLRGKMYE